jgi:energy-coupling factor transporter ATP-binding protein EcfA2
MTTKNFILKELRVHPECIDGYRKILKGTSFTFNKLGADGDAPADEIAQKLFGKRVFIQTIVGKNGSGKSSILEIIYRMINNYSYYILLGSKPKRVAAEPIYLIEGLSADLDFIINNTLCSLQIRNKSLSFIQGVKMIFFGELHEDFKGFEDYNNVKPQLIKELASSSFYTIVTNYSFQSLINNDFKDDIARNSANGKQTGFASNGNWLDSLFRKNDGYITPIVLNPYREDGRLDLNREYYLTQSRMSALLIEARDKGKQLLTGYQLATIYYKSNLDHFLPKFFSKYNPLDEGIHLDQVLLAMTTENSVANIVIKAYGLKEPKVNGTDAVPYAYLVYKTLSIAGKYPQYEDYKNIPSVISFNKKTNASGGADLQAVVRDILEDRSHVNTKIFQTLNYLSAHPEHLDELSLSTYIPYASQNSFKDITEIMEHLPPPYYRQEIMLLRNGAGKEEIKLSSLSSGERQFVYTISTIVYHIKNLLSIQQTNRIRYRNINIVLDEVEICFHPEYQRRFINWFLELIERLNLTRSCSFNILIVTHSPFILSDIPKSNILYLEDGEQLSDNDLINPFAANLNDILYQSFFLEGGFMGEHAKNLINSAMNVLIRKIDKGSIGKSSQWSEETLRGLIDIIGEPLLKDNMLSLFNQAFNRPSTEELLRIKDEEIRHLRDQLNLDNNNNNNNN